MKISLSTIKRIAFVIVIGTVAVAGQLKSVVSINGVLEVFSCVGFIHSQKWVVTAAHCFADLNLDPSLFIVTTRSDIAYPVKSIKRHPNYQSLSKFNDIALVELEIPIPFSSDVGPVNYPSVDPPAGTKVTQISEFDPIILSNPTIISNSDCVQKWGFLLGPDVTDKNICIDADGDQDGLDVDLLQWNNQLVGMFSWGGSTPTLPPVYIRLSKFASWITQNAI